MSKINETVLAEMENDKDQTINVNDTLGIQYKRFRKSMYSISLSKPSVYYELQEKVTNEIKKKMVTSVYKDVYELLRFGKIDKKSIFANTDIPPPGIPSNKVNELAMSITQTLDGFCDELIELILPKSFLSLADGRLRVQSEIN